MNAAYLWAQLEIADEIQKDRMDSYEFYDNALRPLADMGYLELPYVPAECEHNAHMYYIKLSDLEERTKFITYLKENGILSVFHYVPLHTAPAGIKYGRFAGEDKYTTKESERLVRLPMYYHLTLEDKEYIVDTIFKYFHQSR